MAEVKILDTRTIPSADPDRQGKQDRIVIYTVDSGPGRLLRMPDETFTPTSVEAAIKKELEKSSKVVGHTFKL